MIKKSYYVFLSLISLGFSCSHLNPKLNNKKLPQNNFLTCEEESETKIYFCKNVGLVYGEKKYHNGAWAKIYLLDKHATSSHVEKNSYTKLQPGEWDYTTKTSFEREYTSSISVKKEKNKLLFKEEQKNKRGNAKLSIFMKKDRQENRFEYSCSVQGLSFSLLQNFFFLNRTRFTLDESYLINKEFQNEYEKNHPDGTSHLTKVQTKPLPKFTFSTGKKERSYKDCYEISHKTTKVAN